MNLGLVFESKMKELLCMEFMCKGIQVYHEDDLRKLFGFDATGVDFMIDAPSCIVFAQCKYVRSRRRETKYVHRFLQSIHYIKNKMSVVDGIRYHGFWVARLEPFHDNREWMRQHEVEAISSQESMEDLLVKSICAIRSTLESESPCSTESLCTPSPWFRGRW